MNEVTTSVQNICDTARWVAHFRARETQRPNGFFRDPYAERLAGERGVQIAHDLVNGTSHDWAWAARTYLFDQFILREIQNGADLVLNLAAGLDARPYRMELKPALQWVEVDLPEILSYKKEILANEQPKCDLESVSLDLSDAGARRSLFAKIEQRAAKAVVLSEGLLIYFTPDEVASLAKDLAAVPAFKSWVIDLASPGQLKLMQRTMGKQLSAAGAGFKFGPVEGSEFFSPWGWHAADVQGLLKTAAKFHRAPAELLTLLPEPMIVGENYPWTGVCLLQQSSSL